MVDGGERRAESGEWRAIEGGSGGGLDHYFINC